MPRESDVASPGVEDVSMPSTMRYKDRLELSSVDPNAYSRLYSTGATGPVWQRLNTDARARQSLRSRGSQFQEGGNAGYSNGSNSGYLSNTLVAVNTTAISFKSGFLKDGLPLDDLHALQLTSHKKKYPLDFNIAMRPETETMNQTLRMLGTYSDDSVLTKRMNTFVPSGCPGGRGHWHPDVLPLRSGTAPAGLSRRM